VKQRLAEQPFGPATASAAGIRWPIPTDVDHFNAVNDTVADLVGDEMLALA